MSQSFETLEVTIDEHVATVSLNRPDKANAMNGPMWDELQQCFEWLDQEPSVRAVILAGNGKHFCAGMDLAVFAEAQDASVDPARRAEQFRRTVLRLQGNLSAIERCRVPVLAGTGFSSTRVTIEQTRRARAAGADARTWLCASRIWRRKPSGSSIRAGSPRPPSRPSMARARRLDPIAKARGCTGPATRRRPVCSHGWGISPWPKGRSGDTCLEIGR